MLGSEISDRREVVICGRYPIYESMHHYLRQLSLDLVMINGYDHEPINRYNVARSTQVEIIRQAGDERHFGRKGSVQIRSTLGPRRW